MRTYNKDRNTWQNRVREANLPSQQKHIALILLTYVNSKTGDCYPSYDTMMKDWGISREYVWKHLKALREAGWVTVKKVYRGQKPSNHYILSSPDELTTPETARLSSSQQSTEFVSRTETLEVNLTRTISNTLRDSKDNPKKRLVTVKSANQKLCCNQCGAPKGQSHAPFCNPDYMTYGDY